MSSLLIFLVAALYSSVGHGGASGYLAVMALCGVAPALMAPTALILNVLVAGIALIAFLRAGHLSWRLSLPFVATSVPLAFLGGFLPISDRIYHLLLAFALLFAAWRLAMILVRHPIEEATRPIPFLLSLPVGGAVGLLSGMVGVGGGIFLSPLLILGRWATAKQTAGTAALFIVLNSLAGLAGRMLRGGVDVTPALPLLAAAFCGGLAGSYIGSQYFSGITLRRVLAGVLLFASVKLMITAL